MSCASQLSIVSRKYLQHFYRILDKMIEEMTTADLSRSLSHNFIVQMIPHHRAAIEMSHNLLQYTTFIPLQDIALGIIKEQTKSIADMQDILERCGQISDSRTDLCLYQKNFHQITQTMFCSMQNAPSCNDINSSFMYEMIPHHEGAIHMSENALSFPICPELIPILRAIISSQEQGVSQMKRLLGCT